MKRFAPKSNSFQKGLFFLLLLGVSITKINAQKTSEEYLTGNLNEILQSFVYSTKSNEKAHREFSVNSIEIFTIQVNVRKEEAGQYKIIGGVKDHPHSTFTFRGSTKKITGKIVLPIARKAYRFSSDVFRNVYVKEVDINTVLCIDFKKSDDGEDQLEFTSAHNPKAPQIDLTLESKPGSPNVLLLDFDGEYVSNTSWNGGADIDAQPSGFSDAKALTCWRVMAEDYLPFDVNVTTNESVFLAVPMNKRMRVIYTPTTDAAPGSGGVAYLYSFNDNDNEPCWVFNSGTRSASETGSHEAGHTFGLQHDGDNGGDYYSGHGDWAPIMSASFYTDINQWSKGEYDEATTSQNDVNTIANSVDFRNDLHGDDIGTATTIIVTGSTIVEASSNNGIIIKDTDKDVFELTTSGGTIDLSIDPDPYEPNLDIQARLLDISGNEIAVSNPNGLSANINETVASGIYYLEIDGVGAGDPATNGYSDYGSIGYYEISGTFPATSDPFPPAARFSANVTSICSGSSINFTDLSAGFPDTRNWTFVGGTPGTSTDQNPTVSYAIPGIYDVTLEVSNTEGSDTEVMTGYVEVGQTGGIPFMEGFENDFPPANWKINNPDAGLAFEKSVQSGNLSTSSMIMNNADNSVTGEIDEVWLHPINFSTGVNTAMTFDVGYTQFDASSPDELRVYATTICEPTTGDWQEVFMKTHTDLETAVVATAQSNDWVPSTEADWRMETVDLSAYDGEQFVLLKFHNTSGYGTRIWIDNINIDGTLGVKNIQKEMDVNVYPNPSSTDFTVVLNVSERDTYRIEVTNALGQLVETMKFSSVGENRKQLQMREQQAGVYFLTVYSSSGKETVKLIKQ